MKTGILLILTLFLLTGCYVTPHIAYNFETKSSDKIWLNGKELIKLEKGNIEVIVNFDQTRFGIVSFDLAISNNTNGTILITTEDFYCLVIDKFEEEKKIFALNPEKMINDCDKKIERAFANNKSDNRTNLLFSLFDFASTINSKNKTEEEKKKLKEERELREKNSEEREIRNINMINQLTNERNLLENQAFRKTTLFPGQKMSGKLYFSISNNIIDLIIYFPIGEQLFELEYERKYFKRKRKK